MTYPDSERWKHGAPPPMFCVRCGRREIISVANPMPSACSDCGGTSWANRPDYPSVGGGQEQQP